MDPWYAPGLTADDLAVLGYIGTGACLLDEHAASIEAGRVHNAKVMARGEARPAPKPKPAPKRQTTMRRGGR